MSEGVRHVQDLRVYQMSMSLAMEVFELSKAFPSEERYSLTDQVRRSSRSVCANLAGAWQKRRYSAAFVAKLSDSAAEAGESITWLEFAERCHYLDPEASGRLRRNYNVVVGQLITIMRNPTPWLLK